VRFVDPRGELPQPLLPAAIPVMRWLRLPEQIDWPALAPAGIVASPALRELSIGGQAWRGAETRDRGGLQQAGADFAVMPAMSEAELAEVCVDAPIPVYRLDPGRGAAPGRARRFSGGS
jgi:hypothetical protein